MARVTAERDATFEAAVAAAVARASCAATEAVAAARPGAAQTTTSHQHQASPSASLASSSSSSSSASYRPVSSPEKRSAWLEARNASAAPTSPLRVPLRARNGVGDGDGEGDGVARSPLGVASGDDWRESLVASPPAWTTAGEGDEASDGEEVVEGELVGTPPDLATSSSEGAKAAGDGKGGEWIGQAPARLGAVLTLCCVAAAVGLPILAAAGQRRTLALEAGADGGAAAAAAGSGGGAAVELDAAATLAAGAAELLALLKEALGLRDAAAKELSNMTASY